MSLIDTLAVKVSNLILQGADMSDKQFFEREIQKWKNSPQRIMQIKGHLYYDNEHDILHRKRMMIGEGGKLEEVDNLPNNRLIDNQYAKLVNQKANYLLGQPFAIEGENQQYVELLKKVFNKRFMKTLKAAGKAMLNNGICWLYPYYTETGEFSFRMFPGYEVLPFWKDTEHTILEAAVRLYLVVGYQGTTPVLIEKVEIYDLNGVHRFILDGSTLIPDLQGVDDNTSPYTTTTGEDGNTLPLNWAKVPLIPLKYNECEIPLLKKVKTLQDGINVMLDGGMFSDLDLYKKKSFWEKHKTIRFDTLDEIAEYEILAVIVTTAYRPDSFRYYEYTGGSQEQFEKYVSDCKRLSLYDTGVNAEYGDKLITLSTCEYSQNDGRLLVVAKKTED